MTGIVEQGVQQTARRRTQIADIAIKEIAKILPGIILWLASFQ